MQQRYTGVTSRFLNPDERQVQSDEKEMPLVLEPQGDASSAFLKAFLIAHSEQILADIAKYGAVLLRGFDINNETDFEQSVLSIRGMRGISDAFMSEQGRVQVTGSKYVLHTNAVYKTGGTLYLGGFHSENYYSADVPAYISFCCLQPSDYGGETGLINMEKVYPHMDESLRYKLENNSFFVAKWPVSEVVARYHIPASKIEQLCQHFDLPMTTLDNEKYILMYKPNIFTHPVTGLKSPQINYFEIPNLNTKLRQLFIDDYPGKQWFWHRMIWRMPDAVLKIPEVIYMTYASLRSSLKESWHILLGKLNDFIIENQKPRTYYNGRVKQCFRESDVDQLASLMRKNYCSCIWKQGDIMLVDNRKVVHAGMPGGGQRKIRAMICNPLDMGYHFNISGLINCKERNTDTIGYYMTGKKLEEKKTPAQADSEVPA